MNRQPTRTDLVEAHSNQILELRKQAIDARTASRAYLDLADSIKELPSKGDVWDVAQRDLMQVAEGRAVESRNIQFQKQEKADKMEKDGCPL